MLPKEVFDEYAKARMKTLIEKGEIPSVVVGGFIDPFGDAQIINCSRCDTPVLLRPWLTQIVKQYCIRVECICCADPQEVKGQVAMDFAKIETTIEQTLTLEIKQTCTRILSYPGPVSGTPYSVWQSPNGKFRVGIHDADNEIFCIQKVETGEWLIPLRDIIRFNQSMQKLKEQL